MSRRVIFNADDFGLTRSVSAGIIKCCVSGPVRSTSVLVNLAHPDDLNELRACENLDSGIHLSLTVGNAMLTHHLTKSLSDETGKFLKRGSQFRKVNKNGFIVFKNVAESEIYAELKTQIESYLSLGMKPSHLDSHHHVHADETVLSVVINLAHEFELPVRGINKRVRTRLQAEKVRTEDHFEGKFFGRDSVTKKHLFELLRDLPDGVTEIMTHPGYQSYELEKVSGYSIERNAELDVLTDDEIMGEIKSLGIALIGWKDLVL